MTALDCNRLRVVLRYDPDTGVFTWRSRQASEFASSRAHRAFNSKFAGAVAGSGDGNGYVQIRVDGKKYRAHRLAWLYMRGSWPSDQVDHINGNRSDNRVANLRDVGPISNNQNQWSARRNNRLGLLGVHKRGRWFAASIMADGKVHRIGLFESAADAHAAYLEQKRVLHGGRAL